MLFNWIEYYAVVEGKKPVWKSVLTHLKLKIRLCSESTDPVQQKCWVTQSDWVQYVGMWRKCVTLRRKEQPPASAGGCLLFRKCLFKSKRQERHEHTHARPRQGQLPHEMIFTVFLLVQVVLLYFLATHRSRLGFFFLLMSLKNLICFYLMVQRSDSIWLCASGPREIHLLTKALSRGWVTQLNSEKMQPSSWIEWSRSMATFLQWVFTPPRTLQLFYTISRV